MATPMIGIASSKPATMNILRLQHAGQLRLARRAFQEFAAEQREADRGAERAEADQQTRGDHRTCS